jgi:cytochrome c peroxidase
VADTHAERGRALFDTHCRSCHDEPNGSGTPVPAGRVGTEPALAFGHARGTGHYRPSPLVRVADAAPYLHHGEVTSLEALLGPQRLAEDYTGGARGPGAIPGHRWGTDLAPGDRQALVAYLHTL